MIRMPLAGALLLPLLFASCGPVPLAQAERSCLDRARMAEQPRGTLGIGTSSRGGSYGGLALEVSSDWLAGRDPSAVYQECVVSRSGQMPRRPYHEMLEWKG